MTMRAYFDPLKREYVVSASEEDAAELSARNSFKYPAFGAIVGAHEARTAAEKRRIAKWNRKRR